jgi:hypothetical protein
MKFAFAADLDEAGGFKLFDVVREGGGGNGQCGANLSAAQRAAGLGDALEELETVRVGEGFEDRSAAAAGEAGRPVRRRPTCS